MNRVDRDFLNLEAQAPGREGGVEVDTSLTTLYSIRAEMREALLHTSLTQTARQARTSAEEYETNTQTSRSSRPDLE